MYEVNISMGLCTVPHQSDLSANPRKVLEISQLVGMNRMTLNITSGLGHQAPCPSSKGCIKIIDHTRNAFRCTNLMDAC